MVNYITMPKRCALGCPQLGVPTHLFPHPEKFPETFKAWVAIVGGKLETPDDFIFYRKKKICDIHFTDADKNRNHRLNALAVPTLCLPETSVKSSSTPSLYAVQQRLPLTSLENVIGFPENVTAQTLDVNQPFISKENVWNVSALDSNPSTSTAKDNLTDSRVRTSSVLAVVDDRNSSASKQTLSASRLIFQEHNYSKKKYVEATGQPKLRVSRMYMSALEKSQVVKIRSLQRKVNRQAQSKMAFKTRLENARKLNNDIAFQRVTKNMYSPAKLFTKMQVTETSKKPPGRRFTLEQKILSLTLYKKGAKVYSLLSKLFTLPSPKTLRSLLCKIKLGSGVNDIIFDKLKDTVKKMNVDHRLCTLMFDEMAITPQIQYDRANDKLKGFTDFESKNIANHVLVFMIKGVKANYKQPVAYYFTNSVNKIQVKVIIKEIIKKLQATGLTVLCTVCDQGAANVGAINELVQETKNDYLKKGKAWRDNFFEVNNKKIIPIYDVPHLIKGLRNNLLNKDLTYIDHTDNKQKIIKWEYFLEVYNADKCLGELKSLHKLTEEHLIPEKIKKMRVKNAAQVFSHSVAVVTEHLVARKLVREECRQLVPLVILIDNLFDSLNSSTLYIPDGKIYKGCVRRGSRHHQLWQTALKTLKSMKFIIKKRTKENKVRLVESVTPTIKNLIKTIEGMQVMWRILSQNYHFDCMLTRHFNQDPLENFFGNIRSYGVRNVAPNCVAFEGAYKSLLLNNFSSTHSIGANCEKDNYKCLQNLKFFLKENIVNSVVPEEGDDYMFSQEVLDTPSSCDLGQSNYVCGWVLTKCLKNVVKGCKTCKEDILTNEERSNNELIKAKEYNKNKKWLVYPSQKCEEAFKEVQHITVCTLKKDVPKENLKKKIKFMVDALVNFPCSCSIHHTKLKEVFVDICINVLIYSWCRSINRILSGKITYDGDDELKNISQNYYKKHAHKKCHYEI